MLMKPLIFLLLILAPGCGGNAPEKRNTPNPSPAGKASGGLGFKDMAGKLHDVDSVLEQGHAVALVFWQTWCKPCLREMPELVKADRKYSPGLRFYGIIAGPDKDVDEARVKTIVGRFGLRYPQVHIGPTISYAFGVQCAHPITGKALLFEVRHTVV